MINEEQQNEINKGLAIMFAVNMICLNGLKFTYKEIDGHKDPDVRLYFRSLVEDALKFMEQEGLKIKE